MIDLIRQVLVDEDATRELGLQLASALTPGRILLRGDLGAGKTSLARSIVNGLGHLGRVKSPTYTLVEDYTQTRIPVRHWDLYRIADPEELDALGMCDAESQPHLMLVEWPERAGDWLRSFDLSIHLHYRGDGREAELRAGSETGVHWLSTISGVH